MGCKMQSPAPRARGGLPAFSALLPAEYRAQHQHKAFPLSCPQDTEPNTTGHITPSHFLAPPACKIQSPTPQATSGLPTFLFLMPAEYRAQHRGPHNKAFPLTHPSCLQNTEPNTADHIRPSHFLTLPACKIQEPNTAAS